jgi:acetoacetate decarboxylase
MTARPAGPTRPTIDEIVRYGFGTPWDAPTVPAFPFSFRDVHTMTLVYRTDIDAIERLLPPPLEPVGDVVLIHIYDMRDTDWLGPYQECNVSIGARLPSAGKSGTYSPYLFLSSEVGVVHGREVHGQPKKLGYPKLEARGDLLVGTVSRNGIDIVTGTMPYKQRRDSLGRLAEYMPFDVNINLKSIDHIDGRPAIRQLTSRKLSDLSIQECWSGPATVELRPNAQAPVHRLPVREMLEAFYWRGSFTLVPGEIIHDYLSAGGK